MPSPTQAAVRAALAPSGSLTVDEIVQRVTAAGSITSQKPQNTVRNALANDHLCESAGANRYVYLPTFVTGARVRIGMEIASGTHGMLAASAEFGTLLTIAHDYGHQQPPRLFLEQGPTVEVTVESSLWFGGVLSTVKLPRPFWDWGQRHHRQGADAIEIRCEDAAADHFTAHPIRTAELDSRAVQASNARLREAAIRSPTARTSPRRYGGCAPSAWRRSTTSTSI